MQNDTIPGAGAGYADRVSRQVPGLDDLHQMVGLLLAERVPEGGRVLVVGAGGGMELAALAAVHPSWLFDGVDPSALMLAQARERLGPAMARVRLHEGYIDAAPEGPFDGATCLLTLHFLPEVERRQTLRAISQRLKPGAPLVTMHHSFPTSDEEKDKWLARNAAFAASRGMPSLQTVSSKAAMKQSLPVLTPAQDEALLRDAAFTETDLFYAAFTFKGWVSIKA